MELGKESIDEIDHTAEMESMKKVEAALFISGRYLSLPELVSLTDVNPILLKKILEDLNDKYKDAGIELVQQNNSWKMDVAQEYIWMVNRLATGSSEFTKAEQETLAIIAYKQPMKQSVLVKIRGNKAYDHIKKFVEMGLIGKKKIGHTAELSLTEQFHEYFHVNSGKEVNEGEGALDEDQEEVMEETEEGSGK
ncbi:MAG: SMC-Scp complex subunit ScpB [archaeon]